SFPTSPWPTRVSTSPTPATTSDRTRNRSRFVRPNAGHPRGRVRRIRRLVDLHLLHSGRSRPRATTRPPRWRTPISSWSDHFQLQRRPGEVPLVGGHAVRG